MGNSRWRLETSINLALLNAKKANFLNDLEIVVSDWGSEIPLRDVLKLVPEAEGRVKFVHTTNDIATIEQKDSKFPEVIALNAAARRASGEYIGRIDNDTVVGKEFFRKFAKLHQNNPTDKLNLTDSFLFVERRSVPYRISRISLPLSLISALIKFFKSFFKVESAKEWGREFWWSPVGIMMFHRDIWQSTQGYDEKLIYWGWMEGDLALRLGQKHQVVEFSKYVGHDFYHLEHYSNLVEYKDRNGTATARKKNPVIMDNLNYKTNEPNWGLFDHDLRAHSYEPKDEFKVSGMSILSGLKLLWGCGLLTFDFLTAFISDSKNLLWSSFRIFIGKIRQKVLG
ncbi:MAG: hypothetical protein CMI19_00515 [Opitutae bacterium]|nr:hypothetical protein [Opitutae bacterium]|tara:strand:+ start:838 stop:1860 length:1023 start_codon:yes stop_codon:yes gene_type:complete